MFGRLMGCKLIVVLQVYARTDDQSSRSLPTVETRKISIQDVV